MKLVRYTYEGAVEVGSFDAERREIHPLMDADGAAVRDLTTLIGRTDALASTRHSGETRPFDAVRLLAPLTNLDRNIICVGKNYHEHSREFAVSGYDASGKDEEVPEHPIFFTKPASSIIGPEDVIEPHLSVTQALDYEAEVGVVIGRTGRSIPLPSALEHVWGYVLINDVTARDLQQRHRQWFLGKSLDTFCPMGPWVVTADEVGQAAIDVRCEVNGELRQKASTADLIFDIPTLIHTLSQGMTLHKGDVIATGTPAGVGLGFQPPKFLQPGDSVVITSHQLGTLRNTVGAALEEEMSA